jgi:hypothetical protein
MMAAAHSSAASMGRWGMGKLASGALLAMLVVGACAGPTGVGPTPPPGQTVLPIDWTPGPDPTLDPAFEAEPTLAPMTKPESFATLSKRAWQKLVKNPDAYIGKGYRIWACVTQFDAATGTGAFRGDASYHKLTYWYEGDNALFTGEPNALVDIVQGDIVSMSVAGLGSYSYDTQIGGSTTVPSFAVFKVKREKGSCE